MSSTLLTLEFREAYPGRFRLGCGLGIRDGQPQCALSKEMGTDIIVQVYLFYDQRGFKMFDNREAFGYWLSGFTDGEGNFHLARHGKSLKDGPSNGFQAFFRINLRMDDCGILEQVREYFGCGSLFYWVRDREHLNHSAQVKFQIGSAPMLARTVVPHFDRFPLRSKKSEDYVLWREAVLRICAIQERPRNGNKPRWNDEDTRELSSLKDRIVEARVFRMAREIDQSVFSPVGLGS